MSHREAVTSAARSLNFIDVDGNLIRLDSLMVMDLVLAIEESTGASIPQEQLQDGAAFASLDSVVALVDQLDGAAGTK